MKKSLISGVFVFNQIQKLTIITTLLSLIAAFSMELGRHGDSMIRTNNTIKYYQGLSENDFNNKLKIYDKFNKDITYTSKVNYRFLSNDIVKQLIDNNDESNKIAITFINKDDLKDRIYLKDELTSIRLDLGSKLVTTHSSYKIIFTSGSGGKLGMMSVSFYIVNDLIGTKNIYYLV